MVRAARVIWVGRWTLLWSAGEQGASGETGVMSLPDDIGGADIAGAKAAAVEVLRGMGWDEIEATAIHHAEMRTEIYDLD